MIQDKISPRHKPQLTTLQTIDIDIPGKHERQWYFDADYNQDTLLIAAGDSWTWGDSLGGTKERYDNFDFRINHIYGHLLAKKLSTDFINVGLPGYDNLSIIECVNKVLKSLTKQYKKIYIVFTLTETGREFRNTFLNFEDEYTNVLAGPDWPTFNEIVSDTYEAGKLKFAQDELYTNDIEFRHHLNLYVKIKKATDVLDLLTIAEKYTLDTILDLPTKFSHLPITCCVGRNFTDFINKSLPTTNNVITATQKWVDVIATCGNLPLYPSPLYIMSGMGVDPTLEFTKKYPKMHNVAQFNDIFDAALDGITWLSNSPYNGKFATKHPLEQGHSWWSDYLYEQLK